MAKVEVRSRYYALSLGLANGGLFGRVLAFSPGFVAAGPRHGRPGVFVPRGAGDGVLRTDATSRDLVPGLRRDGYVVEYREFDGGTSSRRTLRVTRSGAWRKAEP